MKLMAWLLSYCDKAANINGKARGPRAGAIDFVAEEIIRTSFLVSLFFLPALVGG